MAPAKRKQSSTEAVAQKAKAAKTQRAAAKAAAAPEEPEVVVPAEHKPILELLDQALELGCVSQSSRDMMQISLPSLFTKPKEERHDFSHKVTEMFNKVFSDTEAKLRDMLSSAEEKLKSVETNKEVAMAKSEELKDSIAVKEKEHEDADVALADAVKGSESAQKDYELELEKEKEVASKSGEVRGEKDRYSTVLSETWPTLKAGPETGGGAKAAKARNKEIDNFMEVFSHIQADKSLVDGLPVALKSKAASRGSFTSQLLEHSEKVLKDHLESLSESLTSIEKTAEELTEAVTAAKTKLDAAEKEREDCKSHVEAAIAEAAELKNTRQETIAATEKADIDAVLCSKEIKKVQTQLDSFLGLLAKYGEVRDGRPAAPAVSEVEVAAQVEAKEIPEVEATVGAEDIEMPSAVPEAIAA
mmetsp:Transcript_32109/g.75383  ORF Transcript_32109/g.75383 Transcript_32109/m.75383 type:complete len:417 (+) Transcript_32109:66-1316(+)